MSITWQPGMSLSDMEKIVILTAFRFYHFNKTHTAEALGIAIRTLDVKLESYKENERLKGNEEEGKLKRIEGGLQANAGHSEASGSNGDQAQGGVSVQPPEKAPEEHAVPVQVGAEVQAVPSQQTGNDRKQQGRGNNQKGHGKHSDSRVRG